MSNKMARWPVHPKTWNFWQKFLNSCVRDCAGGMSLPEEKAGDTRALTQPEI
jgi:hypothetical protein